MSSPGGPVAVASSPTQSLASAPAPLRLSTSAVTAIAIGSCFLLVIITCLCCAFANGRKRRAREQSHQPQPHWRTQFSDTKWHDLSGNPTGNAGLHDYPESGTGEYRYHYSKARPPSDAVTPVFVPSRPNVIISYPFIPPNQPTRAQLRTPSVGSIYSQDTPRKSIPQPHTLSPSISGSPLRPARPARPLLEHDLEHF